jgi:PBP1b-binding outer membrane lipoprotein LpoB
MKKLSLVIISLLLALFLCGCGADAATESAASLIC